MPDARPRGGNGRSPRSAPLGAASAGLNIRDAVAYNHRFGRTAARTTPASGARSGALDASLRQRADLEKKMDEQLRIAALEYHRFPTAGKISVAPTKPTEKTVPG